MHRVVIVGPTSAPWAEIATSVEDDLAHLRRPGFEIVYVTTGAGPRAIRSHEDEVAATPHVVDAVRRIADSCDAVVVDCTGDPGVAEARLIVGIPVVGAGEAARRAAEGAPEPVRFVSGEELRAVDFAELERLVEGAATVVVGATGQREVVEGLRARGDLRVIEPLEAAVDRCAELLSSAE
jgi:Asp/Glu/hydantoin racemase